MCAWISPLQIDNRTEPLTQREPWRREAATSHRKHEHTSAAGITPPRPAPRPAPLRLRTRTQTPKCPMPCRNDQLPHRKHRGRADAHPNHDLLDGVLAAAARLRPGSNVDRDNRADRRCGLAFSEETSALGGSPRSSRSFPQAQHASSPSDQSFGPGVTHAPRAAPEAVLCVLQHVLLCTRRRMRRRWFWERVQHLCPRDRLQRLWLSRILRVFIFGGCLLCVCQHWPQRCIEPVCSGPQRLLLRLQLHILWTCRILHAVQPVSVGLRRLQPVIRGCGLRELFCHGFRKFFATAALSVTAAAGVGMLRTRMRHWNELWQVSDGHCS